MATSDITVKIVPAEENVEVIGRYATNAIRTADNTILTTSREVIELTDTNGEAVLTLEEQAGLANPAKGSDQGVRPCRVTIKAKGFDEEIAVPAGDVNIATLVTVT